MSEEGWKLNVCGVGVLMGIVVLEGLTSLDVETVADTEGGVVGTD